MKVLSTNVNIVISSKGPENIVAYVIKNNSDLKSIMLAAGVPKEQSGKYIDVCNQYYYIEKLKQLNIGEESKIFNELLLESTKRMTYKDRMIGHEILSIMIQKGIDSEHPLPDNWLQIILKIADDPRVSQHSEWWSILSPKHIEVMQGWLAGLDLELFLKALENYADSSRNSSLKRMFPARSRFLRGLYDNQLIKLSKLFIGKAPAKYIKSLYGDKEKIPMFSKLSDGALSVIYLKVAHIHMVEGSHSFSLRLYDELPNKERLLKYAYIFRGDELGPRLADKYAAKYRKKAFSVSHHPNLTWQHKAIMEFKKHGISVNPEWVLTTEDYREYIQRFGVVM